MTIYLFIHFIHIDTNNLGLKVPGPYYAELFGQLSLPQSPRQETFLPSEGFESTEESVTLSDSLRRLNKKLYKNILL